MMNSTHALLISDFRVPVRLRAETPSELLNTFVEKFEKKAEFALNWTEW